MGRIVLFYKASGAVQFVRESGRMLRLYGCGSCAMNRFIPIYLLALAVSVTAHPADLVQPEHFTYQGAFRLPGGDERPQTFQYGGQAMTFRPGKI